MILKEISLDELNQFSEQQPFTAFPQSKEMALLQQNQGRQTKAFGLFEADTLVGAGLFILRNVVSKYKIATCNQGPLLDYSNQQHIDFFFKQVKNALKKESVFQIVVTPNFSVKSRDENGQETGQINNEAYIQHLNQAGVMHQGFDNSLINGVGRWFFIKDLSDIKTHKDLLSSMNQSARTIINRVNRTPIVVEQLQPHNIDQFMEIMEHTADRREFTNRTEEFYRQMMNAFGEKLRLYVAKINFKEYQDDLLEQVKELELEKEQLEQKTSRKAQGRLNETISVLNSVQKRLNDLNQYEISDQLTPLAGAMYICHGNEITYLYSGAYDHFLGFDAPYALTQKAFEWALENGVSRYNFYGTMGQFSGHEDEGVYIFKKGFGGIVVEQPGNFIMEVIPFINKLYALSQKVRG